MVRKSLFSIFFMAGLASVGSLQAVSAEDFGLTDSDIKSYVEFHNLQFRLGGQFNFLFEFIEEFMSQGSLPEDDENVRNFFQKYQVRDRLFKEQTNEDIDSLIERAYGETRPSWATAEDIKAGRCGDENSTAEVILELEKTVSEFLEELSDEQIEVYCNSASQFFGFNMPSFITPATIRYYAASNKKVKDVIAGIKKAIPDLAIFLPQKIDDTKDLSNRSNATELLHTKCNELSKLLKDSNEDFSSDGTPRFINAAMFRFANLMSPSPLYGPPVMRGACFIGSLMGLVIFSPVILFWGAIEGVQFLSSQARITSKFLQLRKLIYQIKTAVGSNFEKLTEIVSSPDAAGLTIVDKLLKYHYCYSSNLIQYLVNCAPNLVNNCDQNQKTLLHRAIELNWDDLVAFLVEKQEDVNYQDNLGRTALHYAIKYDCSLDVVSSLAKKQGDIDVQDCYGRTALHYAIKYGRDNDIIAILRAKGASETIQNNRGITPVGYALRNLYPITAFKLAYGYA